MTSLNETAERLREMAEEIDGMMKVKMPDNESVDIRGAFMMLKMALGKATYLSIDPPAFNWHGHADKITCENWKVYDGKRSHEGKSLLEAVNKAIEANGPNKEIDADDTIVMIETALAGQPPV